MNDPIRDAIHVTIARIMEDWGMMLVDPESDPFAHYRADESFYVARIRFHGVVDGTYSLLCQDPFAMQLAENLLGMEDAVSTAHIEDALKEMINVLSGNLLTETFGVDTVFSLTPPEIRRANLDDVQDFRSGRAFNYLADSQPLQILFVLDSDEETTHAD